mmetsp:Transcript_14375/g.16325  ORF Transcript_14375/g.16325 Transcript_14375/m.16325 type:complete len:141 (-) Transcript_14375:2122-2544(-)
MKVDSQSRLSVGWVRSTLSAGKAKYYSVKKDFAKKNCLTRVVVTLVNKIEGGATFIFSESLFEAVGTNVLDRIDSLIDRGMKYKNKKSQHLARKIVVWNNLLLAVAGLETRSRRDSRLAVALQRNETLTREIKEMQKKKD